MPERTKEEQQAINERMARARAGRGQRAKVETIPISDVQEFITRQATRKPMVENSPVPGESDGATFNGTVSQLKGGVNDTEIMYKPTPNGYMPRRVTVGSVAMNIANGFKFRCPDCNGAHDDPNDCAGRDPMARRICLVCGKKIDDNRVRMDVDMATDDPNVIQDDAYAASTPAIRTKAALDWHMWNRHPQESREMGLAPLTMAPEIKVPEALQGHGLAAVMPGVSA